MKAIYKNIALAALAIGAAACTQEDDFSSSYLNDPDAVRITAQVGTDDVTGGFTRSNPLGTTTDEQAAFNANNQISVNDVVYTYDGTSWSPETGKYLKWQSDKMTFTAYYPVADGTDAKTFSVPIEYTEANPIANADYMTYSGEQVKGTDRSINLAMERKMVRIVISPTFNNQFSADKYSVTGIKVHANTKGYANGEPALGNIEVSALQQDDAFYALLAPTTEASDATFLTVTVTNNADATDVTELFVTGIPATTAGNSYNYSLTVGKNVANIIGLTVEDWNTGSVIPSEGYTQKTITYAYEDEIYKVYTADGLEAAIEAAGTTTSTIMLMDNLTITNYIKVGSGADITFDLNEKNLTANATYTVYNYGKLTIKNGTIKNEGESSSSCAVYSYGDNAILTIENVTVSDGSKAVIVAGKECIINNSIITGPDALWCSKGDITVNSGTFTATGTDRYAVFGGGATVTINAGTFTGNIFSNTNTFTIKGGIFTGTIIENASLTIEGGTFSADPTSWVDTENYDVTKNETTNTWSVTAKTEE